MMKLRDSVTARVIRLAAIALFASGCSSTLEIHAMRIEVVRAETRSGLSTAQRPWPVTEVHDDGSIWMDGETPGSISRDGRAVATDGTTLASIDSSGRVMIGATLTDAVIDGDGTLRNGSGDELRIDLDGRVHGTRADAPELRVTPLAPATRRAAMFVIVIGLLADGSAHVSLGASPL